MNTKILADFQFCISVPLTMNLLMNSANLPDAVRYTLLDCLNLANQSLASTGGEIQFENCLSLFDHFMGLELKGLTIFAKKLHDRCLAGHQ